MTTFSLKVLLLLLTFTQLTFSQVLINEVCSSNEQVIADEDGDYSDWIELYNAGTDSVNIGNYAISDNPAFPRKFVLPAYILAPAEHTLIWASDKNRKRKINHWETIVYDSDIWKYKIPTSNIDNWTTSSFDDSDWLQGKGGFGYGDDDDSTEVPGSVNTIYMRKSFSITNPLLIAGLALHLDYDDGFVVWLNGKRVAGRYLSAIPAFNEISEDWHEAVMYAGGMPELFFIDKEDLVFGTNVLSIEIHNATNSSDLTCRAFLSAGISDFSSLFRPTPAWFNVPLSIPTHTNFKISEGETLVLTNQSSVVIDSKEIPPVLHTDQSYGRSNSGNMAWNIFPSPTPGASNTGYSFASYCNDSIIFSHTAGNYSGPIAVSLSGSTQIRFTIDGSEPDSTSPLYTAPINIGSTTVIKAICFQSGSFPAHTYVNTFFINLASALPVWSLSTNNEYFFDYNTGIYVEGPNAEEAEPHFGANYWQDWERPIYVEFFDTNHERKISQKADVRIFGNWSRAHDMKSLLLKGKNKYDIGRFYYKFFHDKPLLSFEDIILRNAGSDYNETHYRDGFIQSTVGAFTGLDYQAYRPSVVYLNGQYWGIHNIREKIGEDFIVDNHSVDPEDFDHGKTWGTSIVGHAYIWGLHQQATTRDMSNDNTFKTVADSFDLNSVIDYFATEIYISNCDWPQTNLKYWRNRSTDNKYKYMLWDTDISLGIWDMQPASFDALYRILHRDTLGPHAEIFRNFLHNLKFRNAFINRFADMMNSIFDAPSFHASAVAFADTIREEMLMRHQVRWNSAEGWESKVDHMLNFIDTRQAYARDQIQSNFNLTQQIEVTLNVLPAGAGIIKINSIYPDTYPWNGIYYKGVPVTITAIPNPGYSFSYWSSPTLIASPDIHKKITLDLTISEELTAYFTGTPAATDLIVSELNYNSSISINSGDWIELYNYSEGSVDLSGWSIRDDNEYHRFYFPENTVIPAQGRLVLSEDTTRFKNIHPNVSFCKLPLGFGLSNEGEAIRIFKPNQSLYRSFTYRSEPAWPGEANGNGYTLELVSVGSDQNLSSSWTVGCPGGSPGSEMITPCVTPAPLAAAVSTTMTIYPNPSRGFVELSLPKEPGVWKIELLDALGTTQHSQITDKNIEYAQLDFSDLRYGVYILKATMEGISLQERIIIMK